MWGNKKMQNCQPAVYLTFTWSWVKKVGGVYVQCGFSPTTSDSMQIKIIMETSMKFFLLDNIIISNLSCVTCVYTSFAN